MTENKKTREKIELQSLQNKESTKKRTKIQHKYRQYRRLPSCYV